MADGTARGAAFSAASGVTDTVLAKAPFAPKNGEPDANGGRTALKQMQSYGKRATDAGLTFTVTHVGIEIRDDQPPPNPARSVLAGEVEFQLPNGDFVTDFVVAGFKANGSLDLPFDGNRTGTLTTDIGSATNGGRNLVLPHNGAIVVSGTSQCSQAGCDHTDVVPYNASGTLDTRFGSGGTLTLAEAMVGEGLVRQANSKLVLVGCIVQPIAPATARFVLMRRNVDGSHDASFDGKIVVSGQAQNSVNGHGLARINP